MSNLFKKMFVLFFVSVFFLSSAYVPIFAAGDELTQVKDETAPVVPAPPTTEQNSPEGKSTEEVPQEAGKPASKEELPNNTDTSLQAVLPTPPTNLKSSVQSDTTINVEWTASQDSSLISAYEIYVNDSLAGTVPGNQTFYTIGGLAAGNTYKIQIKAKNKEGAYSEFSQSIEIPTLTGKKVYELESLTVSKSSGDALTKVNEKESSGGYHDFYQANEAGDYIEFPFQVAETGSYDIELRSKQFTNRGIAQIYIDDAPVGQPTDSYNVTARYINSLVGTVNLDKTQNHIFKIALTGKNSASSNFIVAVDAFYLTKKATTTAPSVPSGLKSAVQSDTSVNLEWTGSQDSKGVATYEIYEKDQQIASVEGKQTNYTVAGLTPGQTYSFKVRAKNIDGVYSDWSNILDIATLKGQTVIEFESLVGVKHSGKPLSRVAEKESSGGYHMFYEASANGDYIEYPFSIAEPGQYQIDLRNKQFKNRGIAQIYIDGKAVGDPLDSYNATARYVNSKIGVADLSSGISHTIKFVLTDKNPLSTSYLLGLDALYLTKQITAAKPSTPQNLKSSIQADTTLNLEWTASTDTKGIDSYEIYEHDQLAGKVAGTQTFTTIQGLTAGTTYSYRVKAKNKDGIYSDWSTTLQVSTLAGKTVLELEQLTGGNSSGKKQTKISEKESSGGNHVFYESSTVGDYIEFPFQVSKAGSYQLDLRLKQFTNRGIAKVYVDGIAVGQPIDLYSPSAKYANVAVGNINLDNRATHTLKLEVTGKNTASTSYILALDAAYLTASKSAADLYEPNNTIATASAITASKLITAYISEPLDQDYYKVVAADTDNYFLTLQSPKDKNYKVEILNSAGQKLNVLQTQNKQDVDVSFFAVKNETVYIRVYADLGAFGPDPYLLRLTLSPLKTYTYDDANHLIKVEYEQGLYQYVIQYEYDRNGNLLLRRVTKTPKSN
ncbi:fibronectin type III domain-containing protein [Paenibacillus sp. SN-8-1]|uniref:fibronectin type III domain-containing protein n=1 Tax=Paenibacillus sp. SN-8-1 TaxID=3435409 RepID=UPI003D9AA38C